MDKIYSKFIGIGKEGIDTLNSYKSKLEKNFTFEEININQDVDKEYVRALLDGIEVLFISYNSEDKKVKDIVKAISFMATERRVLSIGLDLSLKENKDDMGVDKEIKINKYNFEKIQDLINMVVEAMDEDILLSIDLTDLRDIFAKDSSISYSLESFEKDAEMDYVVKTITEEVYSTDGEPVKKKALVLYEIPQNLKENELLFINEINMKISDVLGQTYDLLFSFNSINSNDNKFKVCLLTK